jgi:hypothetical protein
MRVAQQRDVISREQGLLAVYMMLMLPRVCEAIANPFLFNYWRDDPNNMNLLADWITPQSRNININILRELLPAIEQLPLEKDVGPQSALACWCARVMPASLVACDVCNICIRTCDVCNVCIRISATTTGFQRVCLTLKLWYVLPHALASLRACLFALSVV